MAFSAFQPSGYQQSSYQIVVANAPVVTIPAYNGRPPLERGDYQPTFHELERERRLGKLAALKEQEREAELDLRAQEIRIEELEIKRLRKGLADQQLQAELLALIQEQQEIMRRQSELQAMIDFFIMEDDALVVLLMCNPF